jgi:hypothetical protein
MKIDDARGDPRRVDRLQGRHDLRHAAGMLLARDARAGSGSNKDRDLMYLCLSSASREGYSKDVVDTLAAPIGSERQFRYDRKWVDPSIQELTAGSLFMSLWLESRRGFSAVQLTLGGFWPR